VFKAILCCIAPKQIGSEFCGRDYDASLLADLPATADPCGEKGEFHTFVYDGPIFKAPVACVKGEAVLRDNFWFSDILPMKKAA
jgi:diphthamide synthase (EF-2-diphthine--ammonia ligase)